MAEHLPAFEIDNIHFFTSKKGGSRPNLCSFPARVSKKEISARVY
jgi:hypothetical protein